MKYKFQLVYLPFLFTLIGLTGLYTFLHWLLLIRLEFSVQEVIVEFGLPILLAGVAVLVFIRPRLKLLHLEKTNGSWDDLYSLLVWMLLTAILVMAQKYVVSATGKLTPLASISEIHQRERTKYYTLKNYYIDKQKIGVHTDFEVTGSNNDQFNMRIYIALPILEKGQDTAGSQCPAWLGIEYHEQIKNSLETSEKEARYKAFAISCQADFDRKNVGEFVYLDRISPSDKKDGYLEAVKKNAKFTPNDIVLIPVNEPFEQRNGSILWWLLGTVLGGSMVWLLMVMKPDLNERELARLERNEPDHEQKQEVQDLTGIFKLREGYFITPLLLYANIGMFVLMALSGLGFLSFEGDLLPWGANSRPSTLGGEWWRLITCTFLHGGLMHLFANMYGLLFVGVILEPLLGKWKYLTVYLLTGTAASLASIWWYENTQSVGASGAIFGLYGLFLALLLTKVFPPDFGKAFLSSTLLFIGFNLLMGFTLLNGIDNAAHIGGLVGGFLCGLVLSPGLKGRIVKGEESNENR